jgi:putative PIN family toxin of toxin-antitoxin system
VVPRIVLDTNVLISALRSKRGASYKLLSLVGGDAFDIVVSVPLVVEYEAVAKRQSERLGLTAADIDDILDYLCQVGLHREIFFLWRPVLRDPKDDLLLEVAVESESDYIVTHNGRDFVGASHFRVNVIGPREFLEVIGQLK